MSVNQIEEKLIDKQDLKYLAILISIVLVVGVYLILTTVVIAKDGPLYIESARQVGGEGTLLEDGSYLGAFKGLYPCQGYPMLIYAMHKVFALFNDSGSMKVWILSGQAVSLLSRLLACVALYFAGKFFVDRMSSFFGVIILSILPESAKLGSDVLIEWSFLMFLASGFLILLMGVRYHKISLIAIAGILAGFGFLVRSESCQLVLFGSLWLGFNFIFPKGKMSRIKAVAAVVLLISGFLIITLPYMLPNGYVFPRQGIFRLPESLIIGSVGVADSAFIAGISVKDLSLVQKLTNNINETLMYYFVPFLIAGLYCYLTKCKKKQEQKFFLLTFVIFNIGMLLWQLSSRGFLSRRHSLALIAMLVFYIPLGFELVATWLTRSVQTNQLVLEKSRQKWFLILFAIGIGICLPKLLRPIRQDKEGYRKIAKWFEENTDPADILALPDKRIGYYAERSSLVYREEVPKGAKYLVNIESDKDMGIVLDDSAKQIHSEWIDEMEKKKRLVVYELK